MPNRYLGALAPALVLLAACAGDAPTAPALVDGQSDVASSVSVVMSGLNSPKGLALGPEGALYVVETGTAHVTGPCTMVARGLQCYSGTGSITRLWRGKQERIVTGLPSAFNQGIGDIIGPAHISMLGRGNMQVTVGWAGAPDARAGLGELGERFGALLQVSASGKWHVVADVSAVEAAQNPAGGPLDSNPYGVVSTPGRQFVTDAGSNTLLEVRPNGSVSLVAVFPPVAVPEGPFNPPFQMSEAVPTGVAQGPDGAFYVATLTGVPFRPGAASVYRVVPGQAPQVHADGFTQITDLAWAPDGSLYVLQHASAPFFGGPGSLIRIAPDGTRTTVVGDLLQPTAVIVGPDGAVYVSNKGLETGGGEVLRIVP